MEVSRRVRGTYDWCVERLLMAHEAVLEQATDRYLRNIEALAGIAEFGPVCTVLLEFETAPVAMARDEENGGCLIKGSSPAAAASVLLVARRLSMHTMHTAGSLDEPPERRSDDLEVGQVLLEPAGQAITATVELVHGGRRVVATSTGRNAAERHLYLMAEAAARAVTGFLPPGYGVVLGEIQPMPGELGAALKAAVLFVTPTEDRPLEGVAPVADRPDTAPARTVLAAVHEHVRPLLNHPAGAP